MLAAIGISVAAAVEKCRGFELATDDAGAALKERFLREYPAAFQRLQRPLENVTCRGHKTLEVYSADVTFLIKGTSDLEILHYQTTTSPQSFSGTDLYCHTPTYGFVLAQKVPNDPYTPKKIRRSDKELEFVRAEKLRRVENFTHTCFLAFEHTVEEIISLPTFEITKMTSRTDGRTEIVEMEFRAKDWLQDPKPLFVRKLVSAKMEFVPDLDWSLRSFDYTTEHEYEGKSSRQRFTGKIDAQRWSKDSLVFPKRVEVDLHNEDEKQAASTRGWVVDFDTVEFGTVTDDQFTLSKFGLPDSLPSTGNAVEFNDKKPTRSSKLYWLIAANGTAFLLLLLYFALRRRRKRSQI